MTEEKPNEFSLPDALDMLCLPTSVKTSRKCLLSGGFVFEAGMEFTVLQRKCVKLLFGKDWYGNIFRLNTHILAEHFVDVVDESYPVDLNELKELLPNLSYILSKFSQDAEFYRLDSEESFTDPNYIKLLSSDGQNMYLSLESLLSKDHFVFVSCKKTVCLEELLSTGLTPGTIIRFINGFGSQVPVGNVVIDGVHVYENILTVSKLVGNHNELLYQIFQLDSGIKVFISKEPLPSNVVEFGKYASDEYLYRIKEIMFSIHYDIYSPLFYGQLLINTFGNQSEENDFIDTAKSLTSKTSSYSEKLEIKEEEVVKRMSLNKQINKKQKKSSLPSSSPSEELSPLNCDFQASDDIDDFSKGQNELMERANQRKTNNNSRLLQRFNFKIENKFNAHSGRERFSENFYYDWENKLQKVNIPKKDEELKVSKSYEEKSLRSFFSGRLRYNTENSFKRSFDKNIDSGIDSPDGKEREMKLFDQDLDGITNNKFKTESEPFKNESINTRIDGKRESLKKKLSKSDTSLAESMGSVEENLYDYINSSRSTKELSSDYMSVAYSFIKPRKYTNESLKEIYSCSIEDIAKRLNELQLGKFEKKFKQHMINGSLLSTLSEIALLEIGLSHFEARKLYKYVCGWRVNNENCPGNLDDAPVTKWSVHDVKKIMKKIKLHRLGDFAVENQIDGALLEDLIKNNYIKTLEKDHGIRMQMVEVERLRGYVYKKLKYKDHEIAKPGSTSKK